MMTACIVGRDLDETDDRARAYAEVTKSALDDQEERPIAVTVDQVVERRSAYEGVGVERAMLRHPIHEDVDMIPLLGEIAAALS